MPGTYLVRLMHTNSCRLYPGHSMLILYRFLPPPETSWNSIRVAFILSWIGSQPWFWTSDVLPEGRFHRKHSETLCFNGFVWVYPTCSGTLPFFKRFSIMQFFPWTNPRKIHISGGSDPWKAPASQAAEAERLARLWRELRPQALLGAGAAEVVAFSKEQRLGDVCRGLLGS